MTKRTWINPRDSFALSLGFLFIGFVVAYFAQDLQMSFACLIGAFVFAHVGYQSTVARAAIELQSTRIKQMELRIQELELAAKS